jgi:hypothetical protein
MSEEIKKGPMTKEQFEYLCGLRHGVLLGAADFKEAVEAVCEQADIQKSDLNKMINAAVKEQLHELKEKTDALSELIGSVMD